MSTEKCGCASCDPVARLEIRVEQMHEQMLRARAAEPPRQMPAEARRAAIENEREKSRREHDAEIIRALGLEPEHVGGKNERGDIQNREAAYKRRAAKADGKLLGRIAVERRKGTDEAEIRRNLGLEKPIPSGEVALAMAKMATRSAIEQGNADILTRLAGGSAWRGPAFD